MLDLAVLFPLLRVVKEVRGLDDAAVAVVSVIVHVLDIVEQVVVDVIHAEVGKLALERLLDLLLRKLQEGRELRCHGKAIARMALHNGFAGRFLALSVVVDIAGVEIGVSSIQKRIHHCVELCIVEVGGLIADHRQAHHAKSEVFHVR